MWEADVEGLSCASDELVDTKLLLLDLLGDLVGEFADVDDAVDTRSRGSCSGSTVYKTARGPAVCFLKGSTMKPSDEDCVPTTAAFPRDICFFNGEGFLCVE